MRRILTLLVSLVVLAAAPPVVQAQASRLLLLGAGGGGAAPSSWTPIAETGAGSSDNTTVTTGAIDTTGATFIGIAAHDYIGGTTCAPSDSKSNTWSARTTYTDGGGGSRVTIYYVYSPTVGSGHTFTCASANTYPTVTVSAWSGAAASPYDVENGANGNSISTLATGSVTPSENNELVIAACTHQYVVNNLTIDGGFTENADVANGPATHVGGMMASLIQTTAAAANPTCTAGGNTSLAAAIATFKRVP